MCNVIANYSLGFRLSREFNSLHSESFCRRYDRAVTFRVFSHVLNGLHLRSKAYDVKSYVTFNYRFRI